MSDLDLLDMDEQQLVELANLLLHLSSSNKQ